LFEVSWGMTLDTTRPRRELAERVRQACLTAADAAYEDAGLRGLCAEGRWECARQAVASLDLDVVIRDETRRR
jgi:hypothetical protein